MPKEFDYPTKHSIIYTNEIINIMSNRKAYQHKLIKPSGFTESILRETKEAEGDLYDKAAVLLHGLVTSHGFASGNKRTGLIIALTFIKKNRGRVRIKNFNKAEKVIRNIRKFSVAEMAAWLRRGEIDETKIK